MASRNAGNQKHSLALTGANGTQKCMATLSCLQTSFGRPLSAGPRPRSSSVGRPGSNSHLRGSDPSPLPPRREGERPRAYTEQLASVSMLTCFAAIRIQKKCLQRKGHVAVPDFGRQAVPWPQLVCLSG
eukprot:1158828-Pelagomonas_calceolata.AAC.5